MEFVHVGVLCNISLHSGTMVGACQRISQSSSRRAIPCPLSVTLYRVYSHLTSVIPFSFVLLCHKLQVSVICSPAVDTSTLSLNDALWIISIFSPISLIKSKFHLLKSGKRDKFSFSLRIIPSL